MCKVDPKLPSVSIALDTFAREEKLARTVKMFLVQDYEGEMELNIFNDDPDVKFVHSDKRIRIINHIKRFELYKEKLYLGVKLCRNDLIVRWADDDVWMPHAISTMVKYLGDKNVMWFVPYKKSHIGPGLKIKLVGWFERDPATDINICRREWHEKLNLPVEDLIHNTPEYNVATLKDEEAFLSWVVGPTRRESWRPSVESKYQIIKREPTIMSLETN